MATIRQILLNALVSGLVAALIVWYWESKHPSGEESYPSAQDAEVADTPPPPLSDDEIASELDSLASVPADEADPEAADAVTDDEIAGMDADGAKELIDRASLLLARQTDPPEKRLFALGRIALLHGDDAVALKFLTLAANKNYGPAYGYLGDPELSRTAKDQWDRYDKALRMGFAPARVWKEDLEAKILTAIERFSADPRDTSLPAGTPRISDARIMALDDTAINSLIQDYGFYTKVPGVPASLAYGLGRVALLHQMRSEAKEYLQLAERNGSAPAAAYLADPEITSDLDLRIALLQRSVSGGYRPAQDLLENALEKKRTISSAKR